jgi:hypothetical protein
MAVIRGKRVNGKERDNKIPRDAAEKPKNSKVLKFSRHDFLEKIVQNRLFGYTSRPLNLSCGSSAVP